MSNVIMKFSGLHLNDKFGAEKTAQMLDGDFAFCIVDTKKKEVHLGRDTFGVRPMFALTKKEAKGTSTSEALCSEIKSVVPIEKRLADGDQEAGQDLFPAGHYASYSLNPNGLLSLVTKALYTHIGKGPYLTPQSNHRQMIMWRTYGFF